MRLNEELGLVLSGLSDQCTLVELRENEESFGNGVARIESPEFDVVVVKDRGLFDVRLALRGKEVTLDALETLISLDILPPSSRRVPEGEELTHLKALLVQVLCESEALVRKLRAVG